MACSCLSLMSSSSSKKDKNSKDIFEIQDMLEKSTKEQEFEQIIQSTNVESFLFTDLQLNFFNYAVYRGNLRFVKFYLRELAQNNSVATNDQFSIDKNAKKNTKNLKSLTVQQVQSKDRYDNTALHLAAKTNQLEMTRTLLTFTESILGLNMRELKNQSDETPQMICERQQFTQLIMLFEGGPDAIIVVDRDNQRKQKRGIKERFREDNTFERDPEDIAKDNEAQEDKEISELNTDEDVNKLDIAKISSRIMRIKKGFIHDHEQMMVAPPTNEKVE